MSVIKFNVKELEAALRSAMAESKRKHDARNEQQQAEYDRHAAKHVIDYGQAWLDAIPRIRRAVRAKQPITNETLPIERDGWHDRNAIFRYSKPRHTAWEPDTDYVKFENVLKLLKGQPEVSFNQLKELGIGVTVLRLVFENARLSRKSSEAK